MACCIRLLFRIALSREHIDKTPDRSSMHHQCQAVHRHAEYMQCKQLLPMRPHVPCDGKRCDSFSWNSVPMSPAGTQSCSIWDTARSNNHRPKREATRPPSSMWEVVDAGKWAPSWANHTSATASTNEIACHPMPSTPVAFSPASCCFQYHCVRYYPSWTLLPECSNSH